MLALCLLAACTRTESVQTLEQRDLMRLVFKGWDVADDKAIVKAPQLKAELPASAKPVAELALRMHALHVQKLAEDTAVLLVKGEPLESGLPNLIAAYWFQRRGEAWSLTNRQDVVEWLAPDGRISKTSLVELFPGEFALAIEHSHVEKNEVNIWLRLLRIEADKISPLFDKSKDPDLVRHFESGPECEGLMRAGKGKHLRLHLRDSDPAPPHCHDYLARWQLSPGTTMPGPLLLEFSGKIISYREVSHGTDSTGERLTGYDLLITPLLGKIKLVFDPATQQYVLQNDKQHKAK
ncbi:hypothetical protein ACO0LF_27540 [Undibacterium sp. Di27W]